MKKHQKSDFLDPGLGHDLDQRGGDPGVQVLAVEDIDPCLDHQRGIIPPQGAEVERGGLDQKNRENTEVDQGEEGSPDLDLDPEKDQNQRIENHNQSLYHDLDQDQDPDQKTNLKTSTIPDQDPTQGQGPKRHQVPQINITVDLDQVLYQTENPMKKLKNLFHDLGQNLTAKTNLDLGQDQDQKRNLNRKIEREADQDQTLYHSGHQSLKENPDIDQKIDLMTEEEQDLIQDLNLHPNQSTMNINLILKTMVDLLHPTKLKHQGMENHTLVQNRHLLKIICMNLHHLELTYIPKDIPGHVQEKRYLIKGKSSARCSLEFFNIYSARTFHNMKVPLFE